MRALKIAVRTALTVAAAGACALSAVTAQAATTQAVTTRAVTTRAVTSLVPVVARPAAAAPAGVPGSARTVQYDLPDAPVRDDYPWRQYAATYLNGNTYIARQCSAFALWRIDHRLRLATNTTLLRLVRAYNMTGAKDLDNAAARAGYRVDTVPAVGALVQWEAGTWGAGRYGHVAFVSRVFADHTILIEEYNGPRPLGYATRRISARAVSHYLHLAHR